MKLLLIAINAKYIHSNLALYSLKAYASKYKEHIQVAEYTINHYTDDILQQIYKKKPDIVAFSCYIWNIRMVEELVIELHHLLPNTKIWLGGPEVSYHSIEQLRKFNVITGIMVGEGEETFLQLASHYIEQVIPLEEIDGIVYRKETSSQNNCYDPEKVDLTENNLLEGTKGVLDKAADYLIENKTREPLDLNNLPFPYEKIEDLEHKIIYYETSRGCPYRCSYCLSSIDKTVRLRDMNLVQREIQTFLDFHVPQVKFVDRTFNCNREHTRAIWNYIKEHDNGITNFHFEVSAHTINKQELELLASMRAGLVQLEIGVQTTNKDTLKAICRTMNLEKLKFVVKQINEFHTIHQHLDLIIGLPYEDYHSFQCSFNEVYAMKPNQLQLGFLKILKGSYMQQQSEKYGIICQSKPPYEVLFTNWLSYDEILKLKLVEEMVELYYNSGQFTNTILYLEHFFPSPFDFYELLGNYYEENELNTKSCARIQRYIILLDFFVYLIKEKEEIEQYRVKFQVPEEEKAQFIDTLKELLVYDLYLREHLKSRPSFAKEFSLYKEEYRAFYEEEELVRNYFPLYSQYTIKQISKLTHMECFAIDVKETAQLGERVEQKTIVLFDYMQRNPLNYEARTVVKGR